MEITNAQTQVYPPKDLFLIHIQIYRMNLLKKLLFQGLIMH